MGRFGTALAEDPPQSRGGASIFAIGERHERDCSLLDLDPDLGRGLAAEAFAKARQAARVRLATIEPGRWTPRVHDEPSAALGVLVVDGLIARRSRVGRACAEELLGPGDLLQPWRSDAAGDTLPCGTSWTVLEPARIAVLDRRVAAAAAEWPELMSEILGRALRRARVQSVQVSLAHVQRVDARLLVMLWHLAERFGRVTPRGVVLPLRLTHERLAALIGAERPSVTSALTAMTRRGELERTPERGFVLTDVARAEIERRCAPRAGS